MKYETDVINKVITKFEDWDGYSTIYEAFKVFADLDIYLAGGVVRNIVLKKDVKAKDYDFIIAGNDTKSFVKWLDRRGRLTYGQFLSPRWFPNSNDECYCDVMDIKTWNTGIGSCNTVNEILLQFDFTGNALAVDLKNPKLLDPVSGYSDLENKILRATRFDFPDIPIRSDTTLTKMAIHWFRFIYYAYSLNLKIEPVTMEWLKINKHYKAQINVYCSEFCVSKKFLLEIVTNYNLI